MTVKELIKELKRMPQNLEVGFAAHDNQEWELQGWAFSVYHIKKSDYDEPALKIDIEPFQNMPDEWVSIRM